MLEHSLTSSQGLALILARVCGQPKTLQCWFLFCCNLFFRKFGPHFSSSPLLVVLYEGCEPKIVPHGVGFCVGFCVEFCVLCCD